MPGRGKRGFTRRDFLRGTGLGTLGWGLAAAGCQRDAAIDSPGVTPPPPPGPKVVIARDPNVISEDGTEVNADLVKDLVEKALNELTATDSLEAAFRQMIPSTSKVGVKHSVMMTPVHDEVLYAIWDGLQDAGVAAENVITWDRRVGHRGYRSGETLDLDYDDEHVSEVCSEHADVLISVPRLKTHWLAGIAACLKNWAGAVSKLNVQDDNTPWPIHADSCVDIGMMQAHPSIRDKAKLCVVDALYPLCHGGPQVNPEYLWPCGAIVAGTDAVAVDRVCLDIIQQRRNEMKGEAWPLNPPPKHIMTAAEKYGLGEANLDRITVVEV